MPFGLLCSFFFCPPPPLSKYLRSCSLVVNQPSIRQQPFALHDAFSFFRVPHATRPLLCIHHHHHNPSLLPLAQAEGRAAVPVSTEQSTRHRRRTRGMPRTRSASARAAGREKGHQELEQQPNRQEAKKPMISPMLSGELVSTVWAETRWHDSALQTHAWSIVLVEVPSLWRAGRSHPPRFSSPLLRHSCLKQKMKA